MFRGGGAYNCKLCWTNKHQSVNTPFTVQLTTTTEFTYINLQLWQIEKWNIYIYICVCDCYYNIKKTLKNSKNKLKKWYQY
jgi:hypothetical protein